MKPSDFFFKIELVGERVKIEEQLEDPPTLEKILQLYFMFKIIFAVEI